MEETESYLVTSATSERGDSLLDNASGGVDVRLEGGGVFRHFGCKVFRFGFYLKESSDIRLNSVQ